MWSVAKQPCLLTGARFTSRRIVARNRLLSTKNPSSSNTTSAAHHHEEESVQGLANTLRESITRLHQHQETVPQESFFGSIRHIFQRATPQLITMIVSSGAILLGMRSYYYQKTNKIMQQQLELQQEEIRKKNETLVAITSEDFVRSLAEKCAAAATVNESPVTKGKSKSFIWGNAKSSERQAEENLIVSKIHHVLRDELNHRLGDEALSESERENRRKEKLDNEEHGKKAAVRADNETKLEKLREAGNELPDNVIQEFKDSSEPLEVTTDETGNKVVRNKVFRM